MWPCLRITSGSNVHTSRSEQDHVVKPCKFCSLWELLETKHQTWLPLPTLCEESSGLQLQPSLVIGYFLVWSTSDHHISRLECIFFSLCHTCHFFTSHLSVLLNRLGFLLLLLRSGSIWYCRTALFIEHSLVWTEIAFSLNFRTTMEARGAARGATPRDR